MSEVKDGRGNEKRDSTLVWKNVLLVGGTQNGKSQLVKSILSYAGDTARSSSIITGNNNVSQTQSVSSYDVKVALRPHYLEDRTGKEVDAAKNFGIRAQRLLKYREGKPNGYVHLKLLDTPGLGDSNNFSTAKALFKTRSTAELSTLSIVDERHKLAMMTALLDAKTINVICFVMKVEASYRNTVQKHIQAIVNMIEMSKIMVQYHVVHTQVSPSQRGTAELQERQHQFATIFGFSAKHHFVDSDPDPERVVDVYCSRFAVDHLLQSFSRAPEHAVPDIQYPKSGSQQLVDQDLRRSVDLVVSSLQQQLQPIEQSRKKMATNIVRCKREARRCEEHLKTKQQQIKNHDTTDLIPLPPPHIGESAAGWLLPATIGFDWQGNTIIREIEKTYTEPGTVYTLCKDRKSYGDTQRLQERLF